MKLFLAALLCGTFTDVKALGCESELWPCSLVADIAEITCAGAEAACEVACAGEGDCGVTDPGVKSIDADSCRDLCGGVPTCAFYRWDNKEAGQCSFQTECGDVDVTCEPPECVTGEIGCTETGKNECKLTEVTKWNHETFHWICFNGDIAINIYAESQIERIPDGTFCQTTHKCATWADQTDDAALYWRKLGLFCDDGVWKALDESGKDKDKTGSIDESKLSIKGDSATGQHIVEPACGSVCEILELTHIEEAGAEIFCDEDLTNGDTLEDGNSCILICDNHWTMSISCEFAIDGPDANGDKHDGEKQWQDQNGKPVGDEDVTCG